MRSTSVNSTGAAAAVAEVHLAEAFGGWHAQLLLARVGALRVEQPGGVVRGRAMASRPPSPAPGEAPGQVPLRPPGHQLTR
jgi:hypothetical protein